MSRFKILTCAELDALHPSSNEEVMAEDLEFAAKLLRLGHFTSAAWRVADVGLQLRTMIERRGLKSVVGVDVRTGRGALLPKIQTPRKARQLKGASK